MALLFVALTVMFICSKELRTALMEAEVVHDNLKILKKYKKHKQGNSLNQEVFGELQDLFE